VAVLCQYKGIALNSKVFVGMTMIIGIDPGSRMTGYGIILREGSQLSFVDAGTIRTETPEMPERLKRIFEGITRIVGFHGPTEAAVEQVFMASNPDSALKLGQARGAAVAALMMKDVAVAEYTARQIKQAVVGHGAAEKEQVQMMVCRLLHLQVMPQADAADALAAAICHAHASNSMNKLLLAAGAGRGRASMSRGRGRWRLPAE
jgi:crossover junction endodeoxyribonuclease RuvC